jgi:hypothetical protein
MDDEGGGPIFGTSSTASGVCGLPGTLWSSCRPRRGTLQRTRRVATRAILRQLEVAGCHEDRSPPLRGLTRRGRTPPLARSVSWRRTAPHRPNIQGVAQHSPGLPCLLSGYPGRMLGAPQLLRNLGRHRGRVIGVDLLPPLRLPYLRTTCSGTIVPRRLIHRGNDETGTFATVPRILDDTLPPPALDLLTPRQDHEAEQIRQKLSPWLLHDAQPHAVDPYVFPPRPTPSPTQ